MQYFWPFKNSHLVLHGWLNMTLTQMCRVSHVTVLITPTGESSDTTSGQSISLWHLKLEGHRGPVCEAAEGDTGQELCELFRLLWEVGAGGTCQQTVQRDWGEQQIKWVVTLCFSLLALSYTDVWWYILITLASKAGGGYIFTRGCLMFVHITQRFLTGLVDWLGYDPTMMMMMMMWLQQTIVLILVFWSGGVYQEMRYVLWKVWRVFSVTKMTLFNLVWLLLTCAEIINRFCSEVQINHTACSFVLYCLWDSEGEQTEPFWAVHQRWPTVHRVMPPEEELWLYIYSEI